ncbi:MAG: hypothetical protein WC635_08550 [Bacteriovorax sp.]|jgi:isopentenyl phosphate kinase
MTKPTVEELILAERKFLHDMANHIVVAHGMCSFVHRVMKENNSGESKEIHRLERAIGAINKMSEQLKERRACLHSLTSHEQ